MNKNVKLAWKRFFVLFICLIMIVPLFAGMENLEPNIKIIFLIILLLIIAFYWIFAIISIRRDKQKKNIDRKVNKK